MDTNKLKDLLNDIKNTVETMLENVDNPSCLKFFAGKLSLLAQSLFSCINSEN